MNNNEHTPDCMNPLVVDNAALERTVAVTQYKKVS